MREGWGRRGGQFYDFLNYNFFLGGRGGEGGNGGNGGKFHEGEGVMGGKGNEGNFVEGEGFINLTYNLIVIEKWVID